MTVKILATPPAHSKAANTHAAKFAQQWKREPSSWKALIHPRADEVSIQNDDYFIQHWPFPSEKHIKSFRSAGFGRVTCLYFPEAKDDRILFASCLLTVLFLIDGELS